jgi:uncharacterized protein (TIGR02246 family)
MDDDRAVHLQNEAFYEAFNARDTHAMAALWSEEAPCACLHPSSPPIHGREAVLRSWQRILTSPTAPSVMCQRTAVRRYGNTAVVACFELVGERATENPRRPVAILAATNVFVLERGQWRLVHHHSSPIAAEVEGEDGPPSSGSRVLN